MRGIDTDLIEKKIYGMALRAGINITSDCMEAIKKAEREETSPSAKFALDTIIKNACVAKENSMPVCQDTGMAVVLLEIGQDVYLKGKYIYDAVNSGVKRAYSDGFFRKSICDPLTRKNTADNTPASIHTEITEGDKIKITFMAKGFGSENMSKLYMLTPSEGKEGVIARIVRTVKEAGSRPCPPVCVGVGIGGNFDSCAFLAKKALMRKYGEKNPREDVKEIEEEALKQINSLGIGAQGFGGDTTALSVACEIAPTHIAGLPVAVNIQCHCVRCEKEEI